MTTFVLVHGAWHGGWCWRRVALALRAAGEEVFTPTLTGLGERSHLLTPEVGLDTHIRDVAAVLHYEDLREVVLVGHSYAGAVITGVAEVAKDRLSTLVYVEGFMPDDGQCVFDQFPVPFRDRFRGLAEQSGDGWRIPATPALLDVWGITDLADRQWSVPTSRTSHCGASSSRSTFRLSPPLTFLAPMWRAPATRRRTR